MTVDKHVKRGSGREIIYVRNTRESMDSLEVKVYRFSSFGNVFSVLFDLALPSPLGNSVYFIKLCHSEMKQNAQSHHYHSNRMTILTLYH